MGLLPNRELSRLILLAPADPANLLIMKSAGKSIFTISGSTSRATGQYPWFQAVPRIAPS